jgi:hypothetical protein
VRDAIERLRQASQNEHTTVALADALRWRDAELKALRARVAELEAENASLREIPCWVESEDGNPGCGKTADAVEMLGKAYARIEKLEELLSNIVLNAILTPDPSMGGAMDGYMVPIDDIEDARRAIIRR